MSLYGLERRTNFSPFQFDKIYKSRMQMDQQKTTDGIYIGRYILISYGEEKFKREENNNQSTENDNNSYLRYVTVHDDNLEYNADDENIHSITLDQTDLDINSIIATNFQEDFKENLKKDLEEYGNSYHNTVWMKVYRNSKEDYIMIAELDAKAPQLDIETTDPAIKAFTNANGSIMVNDQTEETWQEPYFDYTKSSDLSYTLKMPKTHRYKVKSVNCNEAGFNYQNRSAGLVTQSDILNNIGINNNNIYWQYYNEDSSVPVNSGSSADGKELHMDLPALGQMASLLYDILFGIPNTADGTGERPGTSIESIQQIIENDTPNEGLLLLIHNLFANGKWQPDWVESTDKSGSILNKPKVIGLGTNDDPCDYVLDFSQTIVLR